MNEMKKIVVAGCGSYHFAPSILDDLFVQYRLSVELWLVDADLDMAELTARAGQALAKCFGVPAQFYYTTQVQKAILNADAVIVCADFLDEEAWRRDQTALDEVGLGKQARLRGGIGGAMQTMRTLCFLADLAEHIKEDCHEGCTLILCDSGYGGVPLARACECCGRFLGVRTLGISGVVEQTAKRLGLYLDVAQENLDIACAGLNDFSWVVRLFDKKKNDSLIERCMKEMAEDSREGLSSQYIDWYGAIPAGDRVWQYELLCDTENSPRKTFPPMSGVGLADYEMRKRDLALLTVHGPMRPQGLKAWGEIRETGFHDARPVKLLRALWGEGEADIPALTYANDGAVEGVAPGRYVECAAHVSPDAIVGKPCEIPLELQDVMEQISLANLLYGEAAAKGSRQVLREALEVDPALSGIDLLYTESVLSDMMEGQKEVLGRFFVDQKDE